MRPSDDKLAPSGQRLNYYWDKIKLTLEKTESIPDPWLPGATDQWMVEYACRRMAALDKDNTHKSQGVLPTREYKSRLTRSKAIKDADRCPTFQGSRRCLRHSHPLTESHRF